MNSLFDIKDKFILITGATGHIGKTVSIGLASLGATILVNGRDKLKVKKLVSKINKLGFKSKPAIFDVTKKKQIDTFLKKIDSPLNVVISNAYNGKLGPSNNITEADYINSFKNSVIASHNLLLASLPKLIQSYKKSGDSSFISIASMYGIVSPDISIYDQINNFSSPNYGAAKSSLIQWTKYTACEYGNKNIRINSISPGSFPQKKYIEKNKKFHNNLIKKIPLRRTGITEELIGPICFLSSKASSYITGTNLVVDGGWTVW